MTVRAVPSVLAGLLGVASALAVGCGGDSSRLLRDADAAGLKDALAEVRAAVEERDVAACRSRVRRLRAKIGNLPGSVDRELRVRLREEVVNKLEPQVADECDDPVTETLPTTTSPAPTGPTGPPAEEEPSEPAPEPEPQPEEEPEPPSDTPGTVPQTPPVEPEIPNPEPAPDDPDPGGFPDPGGTAP